MHALDYIVLVGYFLAMAGIGLWAMRRVKGQEDYFMGGRSFGKLMQGFAAFGAGTGSADPINTARTTFTSGMSGMWSVMYWLFVTPLYWISGVWYRRMRHLTLGDWFVERYQSRALGAGYTLFGLFFYIFYSAMLFTAVGKFAAPLMDVQGVTVLGTTIAIEKILVVFVAGMVIIYGALGGLTAAYWTDLIQGICIIALSLLLIPFGLNALVEKFGDIYPGLNGFEIMHKELPAEYFTIVGSSAASEFPLYSIVAIVILNMVGIVVQPHFIATGGGSAKTEWDARVGLVAGNFAKRFCTVGWTLTALIALALYANSPELANDPDMTWGYASRELLMPGLLGLMLACLLAALMSSADAYMLVSSALVVRNLYAPYVNKNASEKTYVNMGRLTGGVIIVGAVIVSWTVNDVFALLKLTWIVPVAFAAPFWLGHFWRRTTAVATWTNVLFCTMVFLLVPVFAPRIMPEMRTDVRWTQVTDTVVKVTERLAAPSDVARRAAAIANWEAAENPLAAKPLPLAVGQKFTETQTTGGVAIYWSGNVTPLSDAQLEEVESFTVDGTRTIIQRYPPDTEFEAAGYFLPDYLLYEAMGIELTDKSKPMLDTLSLLPKIVLPFMIVILMSLITPRQNRELLDRYYAKMRTPVAESEEMDRQRLADAYAHPERTIRQKLLPHSDWEMQKPLPSDVIGFLVCTAICFGVITLASWIAGIGG